MISPLDKNGHQNTQTKCYPDKNNIRKQDKNNSLNNFGIMTSFLNFNRKKEYLLIFSDQNNKNEDTNSICKTRIHLKTSDNIYKISSQKLNAKPTNPHKILKPDLCFFLTLLSTKCTRGATNIFIFKFWVDEA